MMTDTAVIAPGIYLLKLSLAH